MPRSPLAQSKNQQARKAPIATSDASELSIGAEYRLALPESAEAAIGWLDRVSKAVPFVQPFVAADVVQQLDQRLLLDGMHDLMLSKVGDATRIPCPLETLRQELAELKGTCAEQVAHAVYMFSGATRKPSRVYWLSYTMTWNGVRLDIENSEFYLYFEGKGTKVRLVQIEDRTPEIVH